MSARTNLFDETRCSSKLFDRSGAPEDNFGGFVSWRQGTEVLLEPDESVPEEIIA